jgi:vacuolar-type H+-ATPase subunit I/STV1
VDYDERDLRPTAPAGAGFVLPDAPIDKATYFKELERRLRDHLYRTRSIEVLSNSALKLFSRVGETREAFGERCGSVAEERAEVEVAALRDRYQQRLQRLDQQQRAADDRVRELSVDSKQRLQHEVVAGAGQLLSMFLGGRARLGSLSSAASRRSTTRRTQERLDTARNKVEDIGEQRGALEQDLADELAGIQEKWQDTARRIEVRQVPLEQSDVTVEEVVLLWVPT